MTTTTITDTEARERIEQARRLSEQAAAALDRAHDLLAEVQQHRRDLDSPEVQDATLRVIDARLDLDGREGLIAELADALTAVLDAPAGVTA
ncbi:MAG: hypothetical protein V9E98_02065 [Candidatus Nanopelagicales bacterium]